MKANGWPLHMTSRQHVYEVRPRKDNRGVDLIFRCAPIRSAGGYTQVSHAIGYAKFYSRSHDAVISVYDANGKLIQAAQA